MELTVFSNNKGFTLIELLAAMVIMMVGLLGLLQTVNVATLHNMTNQMRSEGVLVADEEMAIEMSKPFDMISTSTNIKPVGRNIYNAFKNYSVIKSGALVGNSKSVAIQVKWKCKGVPYSHNISSLISKYTQ